MLDIPCNPDRSHRMAATRVFPRGSVMYGRTSLLTQASATPVLIVAYRNATDIVTCVGALARQAIDSPIEIFVCENGGLQAYADVLAALTADDGPCMYFGQEATPDTPQLITRHLLKLKDGTGTTWVHLGGAWENLGYAGGINAWLHPLMTEPDWAAVWVLNPDTQPEPDALAELAAYAERWGKGMVGSRLVPADHPDYVHSRGLAWSKLRAITCSVDMNASKAYVPDPQNVDRRIDSPAGTSMYVTRACIERIGLMDDRYFLFFEDLEWGIRAKHLCGVGYAHHSVVVHAGGTTTGSSNDAEQQSPLSIYLEYRNSILFVRSHFPLWLPWTIIVQLTRVVLKARPYRGHKVYLALRGIAAGVCGQAGRPDGVLERH